MKIKFTTAMTLYSGLSFGQGVEADLEDEIAKDLVKCGCAIALDVSQETKEDKSKKAKNKKDKEGE